MRIVIDMQGAQGSHRQRGIGKYTLSLAQSMVRHCGNHEVYLALNGLFEESVEQIRAAFDGLLPQQNIRVWETPGPVCGLRVENNWRLLCGKLVREAFLASLKPDIVLVSSLFEGQNDAGVTSVGELGNTVPTAVVLYDLIPLIHHQHYLDDPKVEAWYKNKIEHLLRADLLLAISESARQEGIGYLKFSSDSIFNISAAADLQFEPKVIDLGREREIRQQYGLGRPFVMYTGGIDHRKNLEGLVRAYARLPVSLRIHHQLAIVCAMQPAEQSLLENLAKQFDLRPDELVLTGFVPERDLIALYNLCKVFIFPSLHEGFGLPALEAMSCGKAVIASNTSAMPEVLGRDDALFDPRSADDIAAKLARVLADDGFRLELEKHGLEQAKLFSWDSSAKRTIAACEAWLVKQNEPAAPAGAQPRRPKLAYVSPLPPQRTGIGDYSAELLPELARHYDIDVIVAQDSVSDPWINANCAIRGVDWFKNHADQFERVLYHFGNSPFHQHMFGLLEEVPGVVVLHDFFLAHVIENMAMTGYRPGALVDALYQSHGYGAVQQHFHAADAGEAIWRYPCNLGVLQGAHGVITHSASSLRLACQWYGNGAVEDWTVVPLPRAPACDIDRATARRRLNLDDSAFVVCSFGLLGPAKLNHRLLDAWLASNLAQDAECVLVFVGENHGGDYGAALAARMRQSGLGERIRLTGWVDAATFRDYLAAADAGVQLRELSRGETSAAVLDCMNYGLPTIVNAHGSMADLPDDAVWKLPDKFADAELISALETLNTDAGRRIQTGGRGREIVLAEHRPASCANRYAQALEAFYKQAETGLAGLGRMLGNTLPPEGDKDWARLAQSLARSLPMQPCPRQLLVDISELVQRDAKSGIQRVVRSILQELLMNPPAGFRVEPVHATTDRGYRYARQFTFGFLDCPGKGFKDDPVDFQAGDVFLGLDLNGYVVNAQRHFYRQMRNAGVQVKFVVYDLLPLTLPWAFGEGASAAHTQWMHVLAENDGVVCISKAVADEVGVWLTEHRPPHSRNFDIRWFHLGADIESSLPSTGRPETAPMTLAELAKRPTFLMVGTIEPRKGHLQTLAAFEKLWSDGTDVNLVIVGKQGWMVDKLIEKLRNHREHGKRLFWLDGISDEYLEDIYVTGTCLVAASEGEGFGLPLIEAAQHKLPIIARDLPVFREVAGEHAFYFRGLEAADLADAIGEWLSLNGEGQAPQSAGMPWLTWRESAQQLIGQIDLTTTSGKGKT